MSAAKKRSKKHKKSFFKKILISLVALFLVGASLSIYLGYRFIYQPNVSLKDRKTTYIYIPTGSKFQDVLKILYENNMIRHHASFEWLAEQKNYKNNVKPGKYLINVNMNNNELINLLRSGKQEPVKITFNSVRKKEELVSKICNKLEADSLSLINHLNDNDYLQQFALNKDNVLTLFIPNTYNLYWNTSADEFMERMAKEHAAFWTNTRKEKAKQLDLSPAQVTILASIVEKEVMVNSEKPIVAGVYLNRLRKNMKLQADPTVIYAVGDFSIRRVLNKHLQYDSPYNTYKYEGLPPGPICIPNASSIDAVLNYTKHSYLFFCANEDFSGRHNFAATAKEHSINAKKFQAELNRRGVNH